MRLRCCTDAYSAGTNPVTGIVADNPSVSDFAFSSWLSRTRGAKVGVFAARTRPGRGRIMRLRRGPGARSDPLDPSPGPWSSDRQSRILQFWPFRSAIGRDRRRSPRLPVFGTRARGVQYSTFATRQFVKIALSCPDWFVPLRQRVKFPTDPAGVAWRHFPRRRYQTLFCLADFRSILSVQAQ